jgi:hypothetical protein
MGGANEGPSFNLYTDNTGATGPLLFFRHDSASPAVNDKLASIFAQGNDSAAAATTYASIDFMLLDPTNGSEDGAIEFSAIVAGATADRLKIGDGVIFGATSVYPGAAKARLDGLEIGHDTDTTLSRVSAGNLQIESNIIYRAGGTDVPVTDGGTGASTAAGAVTNLGLDNTKIHAIGITIDGGGSAITTGVKGYIEVPYACTINRVTMLADQSGSAVVDVYKDTYANYPPVAADTITASAKPTITTATKSQDSTLTGWTTSVAAGDVLGFNVDSASTITRLHIILKVTKT